MKTFRTLVWVKIRVEQDGDFWLAFCDELGMAGCGISEDEAVANLRNSITALCQALKRQDILEKRLNEKGIPFETFIPKTGSEGVEEQSPFLV